MSVNGARKNDLYIIIYTSLYGVYANAEKEKTIEQIHQQLPVSGTWQVCMILEWSLAARD